MKDTQNEKDIRKVHLDYVGVKNVKVPIKVKDLKNGSQMVQANVNAFVSLIETQKGIHMSHMVDPLFKLSESYGLNKIVKLATELMDKQTKENNGVKTDSCRIDLKFQYFIEKEAPVSKVKSILGYEAEIDVLVGKPKSYKKITVKVPVSTCCPCSLDLCDGVAAHNQKGIITISAFIPLDSKKLIWFEHLINIAEQSGSCEIYPVLRRPDEKYVTKKMFANAKFVEDCVRDAVILLRKKYSGDNMTAVISCENMESIHDHSAYCETWVVL